jgi:hypothetical protein
LLHLQRINRRLSGGIVQATIKERLFDLTPGDATSLPILSVGVAMGHIELVQNDLNAGRLMVAYPLVVRTHESTRLHDGYNAAPVKLNWRLRIS